MVTLYDHEEFSFETAEKLLKSIGEVIDGKTFVDIAVEAGKKHYSSDNGYDINRLSHDVFAVTELFTDIVDRALEEDIFQISACRKLVTGIYISVKIDKEVGYLTVGFSTNPFHKFQLMYTMMDIREALVVNEKLSNQ